MNIRNDSFADILAAHLAAYPLMRPEDAYKLAYQSEFGCGHMVSDEASSLLRLERELPGAPAAAGTAFWKSSALSAPRRRAARRAFPQPSWTHTWPGSGKTAFPPPATASSTARPTGPHTGLWNAASAISCPYSR